MDMVRSNLSAELLDLQRLLAAFSENLVISVGLILLLEFLLLVDDNLSALLDGLIELHQRLFLVVEVGSFLLETSGGSLLFSGWQLAARWPAS